MTSPRTALDRRLAHLVAGEPGEAPLLVGGCGFGRTATLERLCRAAGPSRCQVIDVERAATTPERFYRALIARTPFRSAHPIVDPATPREAFDATLAFLGSARARDGRAAVFLLDEVLEVRTFESFPGLRHAVADLLGAVADSPNAFVMTSRFAARAARLLDPPRPRLALVPLPAMTADDVLAAAPAFDEDTATLVRALTLGRPAYVDALIQTMLGAPGLAADPLGALAALLGPKGQLTAWCRYCYEFRLHRARGYGALKAILDVLAEEEPLTLTAVAERLHRTPGSTRDYLSWLEDVDLVEAQGKRYRFVDPLLRVWVRLHRRPWPPSEDDLAREVHGYALARLPATPARAAAPPTAVPAATRSGTRTWGIIEID